MGLAAEHIEILQSERFTRRFEKKIHAHPDGCLLWLGSTNGNGYGKMQVRAGVFESTHRIAWVRATGKLIPSGLEIDHRCQNTLCVQPRHLELVTHDENVRRRKVFAAKLCRRMKANPTMRARNNTFQVRWRQLQDDGRTVKERAHSFATQEEAQVFMAEMRG